MVDSREFRGIVTGLAAVVGLVVLAASAPPIVPGQPVLQSLRFHLAAGLLVFVPVLWLLGARWRTVGVVLLALASFAHGASIILTQQQPRAALVVEDGDPTLDLLSFNVLIHNRNGSAIADKLLARNPDVVVLMEAAPVFGELDRLEQRFGYRLGCDAVETCDLMMLSKTPLYDAEVLSLSPFSPDRTILARTEIEGRSVRLAAVHLTKPYFDFQSEVEAHRLTRRLNETDEALIVAGDFNAAPWSGNLARLLENTGMMPGPSYPATWPPFLGPVGVPIDNVFTRAPALITAIEALDDTLGSNHRGLWARIVLTE